MPVVCIATLASSAGAQSVQLTVAGGTATDTRGITSQAVTIAPSALFTGAATRLHLGASATRFAESAWSLGGSASAGVRIPLASRLALTADGSGGMVSTSYDTRLSTFEVVPALELSLGSATLFAGARGSGGATTIRREATAGGLFGRPIVQRDTTFSRTLIGALYGASFQVQPAVGGAPALQLRIAEERSRLRTPDGLGITDRSAGLSLGWQRLQVGAQLGARRVADDAAMHGAAIASYALVDHVALELAAGWQPTNLLTGAIAGRYATVGISLRTSGPAGDPALAERGARHVAGAAPVPAGMTRLAIRARRAEVVEVAGDFTNWRAVRATRASSGVWYADLPIAPGRYRYAFRVDGRWQVPAGVAATEDEFGSRSAWLTVDASR